MGQSFTWLGRTMSCPASAHSMPRLGRLPLCTAASRPGGPHGLLAPRAPFWTALGRARPLKAAPPSRPLPPPFATVSLGRKGHPAAKDHRALLNLPVLPWSFCRQMDQWCPAVHQHPPVGSQSPLVSSRVRLPHDAWCRRRRVCLWFSLGRHLLRHPWDCAQAPCLLPSLYLRRHTIPHHPDLRQQVPQSLACPWSRWCCTPLNIQDRTTRPLGRR